MFTLKYEHPHFPEGYEFGVSGLGRVENGGTLEIDEDMERAYVASRGMTVEDAFADSPEVTLTGKTALDNSELEQLLPQPTEEEVVEEEVVVEQPTTPSPLEQHLSGGDENA